MASGGCQLTLQQLQQQSAANMCTADLITNLAAYATGYR